MQQVYSELSVLNFFRNAGESLAQETALLGLVIKKIVAASSEVSNKTVIIQLIAELDQSTDEAYNEVIRNTLELVVSYTPDDPSV
ncbi:MULTISPECIES: biofilm development regulator YmgB/AriR family protein [unclassified Erwinia]|uniref:biofilm development regulator YmgB/AriR family protein n=1 Tax=unclassified Erwinia TaxID=2622719 RepID=UPI0007014F12|nr:MULTISPECIES: biofilm development regulator YmgB/AriR family protein [unclassified Erwinia]KQN55667.1 transcriptional regulator [Erwinia sp. Leaf53]PLV61969.1 regulatory protein AriR [Erwinia sp. B116]